MKKYKNKIKLSFPFIAIVALMFAYSCEEDSNLRDGLKEITLKPTASTLLINEGQLITYTDSSKYVSSRQWTFEGGDITSSDQEVVDVNYASAGIFNTFLEVVSTDGEVNDHNFNVEVYPLVTSEFSASSNAALLGSEIEFTNLSLNTASKWEDAQSSDTFMWEFEGGVPATSTAENPVVAYPNTGSYSVKLTVHRESPSNDAVTVKNDFITIVDAQVISPTSTRLAGLGSNIRVTYEVPVSTPDASSYSVSIDGTDTAVSSVEIDATDANTLILNLATPVVDDQVVTLSYDGTFFAPSGELLGPLVGFPITNTVVNLLASQNPGFEDDGPGGFPAVGWGNWANSFGNNPEDYAVIDTDKHSGAHSLQITLDGVKDGYILNTGGYVPVEEGTYRLSVWMKGSVDDINLDFRSIAAGWAHASLGTGVITTTWTKFSFDFSTVGDTALERNYWQVLRPLEEAAGTVVLMDDVSLYRVD
ncbi:hypothetical protein BW723_03900 [Polaribacter reichenbachii]|uniref:PKD domain-containing protein n=1 Tax=Polaribacter reichenbachii TaxID=996801 RepID=A0A1B8TV94_9FLAO|nr:PKD domain-containing protein [Polaribacter reichenbachii]APZ45492.1 hypothetical protein BW723_03900 [Polaribacter reichenbachii]AUC19353.1 hypothetical protein BTO17_11905 [Polaribacter reichenbachii]OBY63492.1 hypothetical protein LPB301_11805 [Polaribacter reichenbachii]